MATEVEDSKIVWPVPERDDAVYGEDISWEDAILTLQAIESAKVDVTSLKDLNTQSGDLHITVWDYDFCSETIFKSRNLKEALLDELGDEVDNINDQYGADTWYIDIYGEKEKCLNYNRSLRLLIRLLRAYEEWEREDAQMTLEQMKANPLPKLKF